jgi:fimbrial isopeptide formation D2 family protein/LPXTG-motif cell wall-anchored protein
MLDNVPPASYEDLAKVFNTSGVFTGSGTQLTENSGGTGYEATGLADGWYLVKDETSSLTGSARSANILAVKGSTAITPKYSLPTLEKKIVSGVTLVDANTAAIGDTITYQIKTKVPDTTGYNRYFFIVEDNLSAGLTYNADSIAVKVCDTDDSTPDVNLTKDADTNYTNYGTDNADYYVTTSGTTNIKIVFEDVLNNFEEFNVGDDIVITYTATLNSNASIDPNTGNPNSAKLIYSNDPNVDNTGIVDDDPETPDYPDEPLPPDETPGSETPGDVVGETPWDKVNTYTTAIKIKKVDQDGQPLKGATFTLQGTNLNQVNKVSGSTFTQDDSGTYWKLNNGSYTLIDPDTLDAKGKANYDSLTTKYTKTLASASALTATGSPKSVSATVDDDGYLTFSGLNAGDYTLVESGVPSGYNKADDISFRLSTTSLTENSAEWANNSDKFGYMDTDDMFPTQIVNRKGSILPTTGGIGTKLFYIFGSILVAGSVIFLVTKKRMSAKEN